ncbi:DUF4232 domain-containing protein [Streptomyces noursei]|uniref:DUF4232 domain-containing protein n=1 Tax=Streptomyces noursei TaxID=1971 RepID=A0A2N8P5L0_STRNR|nr:DUF4232 domain-containing protein [Streptomyces noursei]PNE36308.1 hypothetical protein AOB60_40115 [Streptomyces noursei]
MPFRPAPASPPPPRRPDAVRRARPLVVALLAATALSLTACQDGGGYRAALPLRAVSPAPSPFSGPDPRARDACTPEMLRFHAGAEPHRARHMLLTVTNISDRTCTFAAQPYPLLHFGDHRPGPVPPLPYSRPHAPVALPPDGTAYAVVLTDTQPGAPGGRSAPRSTAEKASQFGVALAERTTPAQVGVDGRGPVRVDPDTAAVTYWQPSLADAGRW